MVGAIAEGAVSANGNRSTTDGCRGGASGGPHDGDRCGCSSDCGTCRCAGDRRRTGGRPRGRTRVCLPSTTTCSEDQQGTERDATELADNGHCDNSAPLLWPVTDVCFERTGLELAAGTGRRRHQGGQSRMTAIPPVAGVAPHHKRHPPDHRRDRPARPTTSGLGRPWAQDRARTDWLSWRGEGLGLVTEKRPPNGACNGCAALQSEMDDAPIVLFPSYAS